MSIPTFGEKKTTSLTQPAMVSMPSSQMRTKHSLSSSKPLTALGFYQVVRLKLGKISSKRSSVS